MIKRIKLKQTREGDVVDITEKVEECVDGDGVVVVHCTGSTGAITTLEFEPGCCKDLFASMEKIAPKNGNYAHEEAWHDGNGHSHVRAAIVGPSLTVPVEKGKLLLGTWQQIVFVEFDNKPRNRELIVSFSKSA